jgi:hypothetical protein
MSKSSFGIAPRIRVLSAAALLMTIGLQPEGLASTPFVGTITTVGTYGDGSVFFVLSGSAIDEPGCISGQSRIDISGTHSKLREIVSIVLTAKALGKTVQGTVNGCSNGFPTLDESKSTYLYTTD